MRKQTTILAVLSAAAVMAAATPAMTGFTGVHTAIAASEGWVEEEGSWHYYDEDGYQAVSYTHLTLPTTSRV